MPDAAREAAPPAPTTASAKLADRALEGLCIGAIAFLLLQLLTFGHGRDQGIYTMVARAVLDGGMPYRDAWDFKPPGIFLIYALARALFGAAPWGIRVLEAAGLVAMSFGLVRLARVWWGDGRIGLVGAAIAVLVHVQLDFWHTAQPESFAGMLTIAALTLAPRPGKDGRLHPDATPLGAYVAAGALFGFAGLLKPPLAGGAVVVMLVPAWAALRASPESGPRASLFSALRAALRPGLALLAGGALPFVVCLAWFAAKGALGDLHRVLFVFTPHYTALGWEGSSPVGMLYYALTEWLQHYASITFVGLMLLLGLGSTAREKPLLGLLLGIIAMHLVGVAMQGKFFPYHYGATWPLTALVAALGISKAWGWARQRGALGAAGFFVALAVVMFARTATKDVEDSFLVRCKKRVSIAAGGFRDQRALDRLASVADVDAVNNRGVADFLRARVPQDRPVFVWGFEPAIYDMSGHRPATRYLYDVPQRVSWAKEEARRVLMEDLSRRPPAAIVVEHHDVFPMVTGDAIDSADTLHDFHALRSLVHDRYELAATIDDLDVYLERP
ncbi:glycosyltransferase family 39 protein [Polyangium aurulentum]|nr:glycosyltransferase family 39 protein [Polyangium aurulentum]